MKSIVTTISIFLFFCFPALASEILSANNTQHEFVSLIADNISTGYYNLALNPNDTTSAEPTSFPHASSNSEYNKAEFAARCAIDGKSDNNSVHECGSWGPQKEADIWWRLDFGRPVEIDKIVLFLRAAWFPENNPHDSYWKDAVVAFSDGSRINLQLKQIATGQEFTFPKKTVRWLLLTELKPVENKWCALCEFEAWGRDASDYEYVATPAFASDLREDPLVDKAIYAMMGFQRDSWEQGVAGQALIEAGEINAAVALARSSLVHVNKQNVAAAKGGSPTDPLMLGNCLWWSAHQSSDPTLLKAAQDMLQYAIKGAARTKDGTPYHQPNSGELWSDGSFTSPPFLAAAGEYDTAISHLLGIYQRLWDKDKKLMHHRWSEKQNKMTNPAFWGGGCGWTAAGFARVIRSIPPERASDRVRLAAILKVQLDSYIAYQRKDGLFHDYVDDPSTYVETNMSAMLAYAIYESVRGGWLSTSYLDHADKMRAAVRAKVDNLGFVQGVAGAPGFNKPGISTEGQAFFILMEASAKKAGR